jgi:DNA-directed RNA polymerase specialized sigma24 family protein
MGDEAFRSDEDDAPAVWSPEGPASGCPEVGRDTFLDWFNSTNLRTTLHRHVCRCYGLSTTDADDVLQEAYFRASLRPDWPALEEKVLPWMKRFAFFERLEFRRQQARRLKRERPVENVDTVHEREDNPYPARAAEFRFVARTMAENDADDAKSYALLESRFEKPIQAVAADFDMKVPNVYLRTNRFAVRVAARMMEGSSALTLAIAIVCLIGRFFVYRPSPIAFEPAPAASDSLPAMQTHAPVPVLLRQKAQRACDAKLYAACRELLDQATSLDPDGDKDPTIAKLRKDAQKPTHLDK